MGATYRNLVLLIIGFTIVFATLVITNRSNIRENNLDFVLKDFNNNLQKQSKILKGKLLKYEEVLSLESTDYWPLLEHIEEDESYYVFVFSNSNLLYWNNSDIFITDLPKISRPFLINNLNSWYLGGYTKVGQFEIYLLKPIISNYTVKNQHIEKLVYKDFSSFSKLNIVDHKVVNSYEIVFNSENQYYLEINTDSYGYDSSVYTYLLLVLAYFILTLLIIEFINYLRPGKLTSFHLLYISLGIILTIRILDCLFQISNVFVQSELFRNPILLIPFLTSIGDLLITSIIFLVFAVYSYKYSISEEFNNREINGFTQLIYLFLVIVIPYFILSFMSVLIRDYGITESYFFFIDFRGFIFSIILILFGLILYLMLRVLGLMISRGRINIINPGLTILFSISIVLLFQSDNIKVLIVSILLASISIAIEFFVGKRKQFYVLHHLIYIIIISVLFSVVINRSVDLNKSNQQINVSGFLNQVGDKSIEKFWNQLQGRFENDGILSAILDSSQMDKNGQVSTYLIDYYLSNINQDIDFQITVCSKEDMLNLENEGLIVNCNDFFIDMKDNSLQTIGDNLFLISNEPDNIYYLGEYRLSEYLTLYIEFYSFYVPSGLGYAELLVDRKAGTPDLSDFSFAKYNQNILISKFGEYEYHTTANIFNSYPDSLFFTLNGFKHYKTYSSNGDILIVSRPLERLSSQMISFSMLFLLFTIFFVILAFMVYGSKFKQLFRLNFRARLQLFFMIALSSILFTTAIIIMYYTEQNSKITLENELNEKAHSVLIELQHKLSDKTSLEDVDKEQLGKLLQKFSLVFFSDINIYDTEGKIVASSRPQIFEEGFLSGMVNPKAFEEIFVDNLLYYNCTENIGSLKYFSTYLPLMLTAGEPAGIINLPYFARQKEQRRSFRFLLFTFINLFVILGILGTIIAVFYSRLLTKPLTVLQQNIANIRIDTQNAKIKWQSDDEIGQLISEYNKMVDKLEASTEILKRSEREIAWREVARQIAHEIKNPLTPMKLNIQYLEKAYGENDKNFGDKLKDISRTLIQQIETLDKVAETFSDMAKSNIRNFKEVDLLAVIRSTTKLFDNSNNIVFDVVVESDKTEFMIRGINKDITQIFNNLLKNSVEAIGDKKNGRISIKLSPGDSYYTVKITDNGNGIPDNRKEMIFTPYFTTRSKGTGLGLAIVKTIITDMGGNIKLESTNKSGTTFVLKILKTK